MRYITVFTIIASLLPLTMAPVSAQDLSEALEEVIVVARKRAENVQDVPISITVFNNKMLERLGAARLKDLEHSIPNLAFTGPPSNASPVITVRGISGEVSNVGFESSLSVYVDGVYQGRPTSFNQDLVNVDSLQVLRGPQGTFFGRNTTAGAVVISNSVPDDELRVEGGAEYSRFDTVRVNGTVSGPINEGQLYGRVSAHGVWSDGYMENTFNNDEINNEDSYGVNFNLRATPNEGLELNLRGDITIDRREFLFAEQTIANVTAPVTPGRFTTNLDGALDEERDIGGISLTADLDVFNDHTLTSITAWRFADVLNRGDVDGGPIRALNQTFEDDQWQFSQELRIASPAGEQLNYVAGIYYFYEEVDSNRVFDVDQNLLTALGVPPLPFLQIPPPATNVLLEGVGNVETENIALFAHANYQLTKQFSINVGGRYTYEKKEVEFSQSAPPPLLFIFNQIDFTDTDEQSESDFSPTFGAAFDVTDKLRFYTQITRGFKGGGWNLGIQTTGNNLGTAESISFQPETIWNYEIGMRSLWLDGKVMLNVTGFYMDYDDLQVRQFDTTAGISRITNAGSATNSGFELEFLARATSNITIAAGLGYVDATFDEFSDAAGPGVDFDGNRLSNAPKFTASSSIEFNYPLDGLGTLVARGGYSYRSKTYFDSSNVDTISQDGYGVINARIGLVSPDERWEVFLWGKNLADEDYVTTAGPAFFGGLLSNFGIQRTYGIRIRYRM